jgi:sarcosine oxidase
MTYKFDADVAVIGVGAMGSMALWRLAERGIKALGFEQFEPAHDRGSSHGESRIIRTAYNEDPRYVPLVKRAFDLWRELERVSATRLLTITGIVSIGPPEGAIVRGTLLSARSHHLDHEILDRKEMSRRFPQHRLNPGDVGVFDDSAGILFPEDAVLAAVRRAEDLGARVLRDTRVHAVEAAHDAVSIAAGDARFRVRKVIASVGPWLGAFLPELRLPIEVARQVMAWFPVREVENFRPERFPVFLHEIDGVHTRYGFPTLDGATLKVAVHHEGDVTTADNLDRKVYERDFAPIQDFVERFLVGVEPRVARSHVCMYANTPDYHFLVGSHPGKSWMTVLGGFCGHGFKFAPVMGEAAADLATTGFMDSAFDLLALDRFAPARA